MGVVEISSQWIVVKKSALQLCALKTLTFQKLKKSSTRNVPRN